MNIKNIKKTTLSAALLAATAVALASSLMAMTVSAQVGTSVSASVAGGRIGLRASTTLMRMGRMGSSTRMSSTTRQEMLENRQNQTIGMIDTRSTQEISVRVGSLNALSTRLSSMKNLSAQEDSTLSSEITTLIGELTGLQAKIQADASSTPVGTVGALASSSPLRQDFSSITKAYRVYALVIPQTEILAAADRINTITTSLTTLSAKLQSRLTAAQENGTTVGSGATASASLQADLTDLNNQTANAQAGASSAVAAVSSLVPDNGDTTIATSNSAALKSGRADILAAQKDINAADKDAHTIVAAIEGMHPVGGGTVGTTSTTINTSATTSVTSQ